jgi:hypothetical protein
LSTPIVLTYTYRSPWSIGTAIDAAYMRRDRPSGLCGSVCPSRLGSAAMEPISSLLTGQVAGYVSDKIVSAFKDNVVERWSKHRANVFFHEFCSCVCSPPRDDLSSDQLARMLSELFEDDARSEILFDAYRSVCLSRSKNIGPRVIAIVVAEAVCDKRLLSESEDMVLLAAESLSDGELVEFYDFVHKNKPNPLAEALDQLGSVHRETLKVCWQRSRQESSRVDRAEASIAPLSLAVDIGLWAEKLSRFGLLRSDLTERQYAYEVDFDRHIDEPGTMKELAWWIEVSKEGMRLAELVGRVQELVP